MNTNWLNDCILILWFVLCSESGDEADDEKEREKTIDVRLEPLSVETAETQPVPVPSHYVKTLRLTSEEIVSSIFKKNSPTCFPFVHSRSYK